MLPWPTGRSASSGMPRSALRSLSTCPREKPGRSSSSGCSQLLKLPKARPASCCRAPLRRQWVSIRSMRYGASPTSSSTSSAPRSGGHQRLPSRWVATVRLATSSGPSATPPPQPWPSRGARASPNKSCRSRSWLQAGSVARVVTRGPWIAPGRPAATWAQSRLVTSENPSSQPPRGCQSCSSSRADPQPPRAQAQSEACPAKSASRALSSPAR